MNILVTGSSGFVGTALVARFLDQGHHVTGLGRSRQTGIDSDRFEFIQADTSRPGDWQNRLQSVEAVINLAGANIFRRWTPAYKKQIYDSRILTTRHLVQALPESDGEAPVFCSTSAVGYYGDRGDDLLTESDPPGDDFLARVCIDWEAEARKAETRGCRLVIPRFGIVLGKDGGALAKMVPAYRLFLGGSLGDGRQWFPWIHLEDLLAILIFAVENRGVRGVVNACAPEPARNKDFSALLARHLGRPSFFRVPKAALNLAAGELGALVLNSQRATPEKLTTLGFHFQYSNLQKALQDLL